MPSFAELRAKAEAAASTAKETANSKIADYRGDKKPDPKPAYKAPPRRPAVKPPLPPQTSRPRAETLEGYDIEESIEEEREVEMPVRRAVVQRVDQDKGIEVLLQNKELFFQFMDQFFAAKGYDVHSRLPIPQDETMEEQEELEPEEEEEEISQEDDPGTPTETHQHQEQREPTPSPPPPPIRKPPPPKPKPRTSIVPIPEPEEAQPPIPPAPRRLPPPIAHQDTDAVVAPGRTIPPAPVAQRPTSTLSSGKPSAAVQALFSNLQARPITTPLPDATAHSGGLGSTPVPPHPNRPVRPSLYPRPASAMDFKDEYDSRPPSPPLLVKSKSSALGTGSPPPLVPPTSSRPPPVNRTSRPSGPTPQPLTPLSNVKMHRNAPKSTSIGDPPSMFFSGDTNAEWTPPLPYGYMPSAGRNVTEGQCSAAQLCSYFAASVPWDTWYAVGDSSARPASIVDRVEARWKGSVMYSQETKKRLFGAGKTKNERSLTGVVTFQDLSIAWYRVTFKEEDPIKSLQREARYRAAPSPWNGEKLYAAHLLYGQAITDFCERAIRMRQLVGGGEAWDLANGALTCLAKYVPNAPPVIPSVGHCHGHLIYEGYVDEGSGRVWGATRGGETAIRNGDIIEWCETQVQIQDENEEVTIFSFGSGYTSVILSAVEFPERLDEDAQTLPPTRLPDLEIVMQSAASGMVPTRKLALLSTLAKGRIWIYRPVGWEYVGLNAEPDAEWPPPDPTLFLPS